MLKRQAIKTALAMVMSVTMAAAPALANPGNGNGNGEHGNSGKNIYHGDKGNHGHSASQSDNGGGKGQRKNYGKPDHVDSDISYTTARALAVNYGLTGYKALPPGIAKNLARGKPLPPGITKKTVPASMLNQLPYYPGYEWRVVGDDLVLIALSTAVVTAIINSVFD